MSACGGSRWRTEILSDWSHMLKQALTLIADMLAAKARLAFLFLFLACLTLILALAGSGSSWLTLVFFTMMALMLVAMFGLLIRFWAGVAAQMVNRDE